MMDSWFGPMEGLSAVLRVPQGASNPPQCPYPMDSQP